MKELLRGSRFCPETWGPCLFLYLRMASIYSCYVFKNSKGRSIVRNTKVPTELDSFSREQDKVSITTHKPKCLEQKWVPISPERRLGL